MKFIPNNSRRNVFRGEDGEEVVMIPGRDGVVTFLLHIADDEEYGAELAPDEVAALRDVLLKYSPGDGSRPSYTDRSDMRCKFESEDGVVFSVRYANRGEPYREGLTFDLTNLEHRIDVGVFLTEYVLRSMRDAVLAVCPKNQPIAG